MSRPLFQHDTLWQFIMSFTSQKRVAKNFKQFSSFDETLITGALSNSSLSAENLSELTNFTTQWTIFHKENKCIPDEPAEHTIKNGKQTKA